MGCIRIGGTFNYIIEDGDGNILKKERRLNILTIKISIPWRKKNEKK